MNYLLIGKPNVGKSSIYNILTGSNSSIIHSIAGTTRDWHVNNIENSISLIYDTPGILIDDKNKKNLFTKKFNEIIINKVNIFLYVIDYKNLFNQIDNFALIKLREYNKQIILIINKFDNYKQVPNPDIVKYGIKDNFFISCSHKYGFENLNKIFKKQNNNLFNKSQKEDFSIAIFGKPNSGKSTFLNTILGYERVKTSHIAGTTSDYVIEFFNYKKKKFKIIDTAGINKKANIDYKSINFYSIKKTFENIIKVDSSFILIDANDNIDRQDKRIIKLVSENSKSIIIIFNKIDLIKNKNLYKLEILDKIKNSFREIKNIKIFFISAFSKKNINNIFKYLYDEIYLVDNSLSTSKLNLWLKKAISDYPHPLIGGKKINFKYAVQIKKNPITIKIFCNYSNKLKNDYKRYLINNLNLYFKILNQKSKIIFSSSQNPYI